ncbi:MAG: GGDEF domain-containing protein [Deltaproteobacteria bacterium]|jgi:two-component system cell cycle response regulator|nr:GGDEF domain-containing protein [Deltaproteobacteria bacterium]
MQFIVGLLILALSFVFLFINPGVYSGIFAFLGIANFALILVNKEGGKQTSKELENLVENLNERSSKDKLTGSWNRGTFDKYLSDVYRRFTLFNEPFFVIFFDIDHFKKFNDTYGHEAGDRVLKGFSESIMKHTRRDKDRFFRYGGEEFVMVVAKPNIPPREDAAVIIKNLRKVIDNLLIQGLPKITCSMGVGFPDSVKSKEEIVKEADENVYRAKENGRNRAYLDKDTVII